MYNILYYAPNIYHLYIYNYNIYICKIYIYILYMLVRKTLYLVGQDEIISQINES